MKELFSNFANNKKKLLLKDPAFMMMVRLILHTVLLGQSSISLVS